MLSLNCEQDWKVSGHCSISVVSSRNNLPKAIVIVRQSSILARKTFLQRGNSQGMLSQEWAAIRTTSCIYLMRNRKDPEIHTEPTIELLFCGVAGNGVRVCVIMLIEHDRAKRYYEDGNWKGSYPSD